MFANNLNPTFYAMQMQSPVVLTHAQMKHQVDGDTFIEAHRPEIKGLSEIGTFEYIPTRNLPTKNLIRRSYMDIQTQMTSGWIIEEIQSKTMHRWKQVNTRNRLHIIFCNCRTMKHYLNDKHATSNA
jgi:hypothetical protein